MIRVSAVALVVTAGAGCAQLAGLDDTTSTGRSNSVALTRMSIGRTVELSSLDLTGLHATYFVPATDDPDRVVATLDPDHPGVWRARLPDPVPVELTLPAVPVPLPTVFAFPSQALAVPVAVLEHPDPAPAPAGAMLTLTVPLDTPASAGETFQLLTVGAWSLRSFLPGEVVAGSPQIGPLPLAFNTATSISGRPQLDRLTIHDSVLVLRFVFAVLTGYAEAEPFDQTGTDAVTMPTMTPVVRDRPLEATFNPAAFATRYAAVRPAVTTLGMAWTLAAAPGYRIASMTGPTLGFSYLMPTETSVSMLYGNPFAARGWHTIFNLSTAETRVFTPAGTTTPVTLTAAMNQYVEPPITAALDMPAGLPTRISIDGNQLTADGQTIAAPHHFAEVRFSIDQPNATMFGLQLLDLVPNAMATAIELHTVFAANSDQPLFNLPPEIFEAGHNYTLRAVSTFGGFPGIAHGDLLTRELPLAQAYLDSAVFTVTP